jgi:hypothetical protein
MTEEYVLDIEALRRDGAAENETRERKTPKNRRRLRQRKPGFIILPADWVGALKQITPHPLWGVALYLVQKFVRSRENGKRVRTITVSNSALENWGIGSYAKVRDLRIIEAAGLIKIEPLKPGQSPRVTWLSDPQG